MTSQKMHFTVLLFFIKIALCENFELDKTQTSDVQIHETTDHEVQIQDTRFRRATNSEERNKCGKSSQCTGNHSFFADTNFYYNCYCDNACYETFQDCCPDFVKTCGEQKKTTTKNSRPACKCLAVLYNPSCTMSGPTGIWMIANCSRDWALDETRTRCENAPEKLSYPYEDYLPVVDFKNGFTYRNKHCAKCNGQTSYKTWEIGVFGGPKPPKEYSLDDKIRFVLANGGKVVHIEPAQDMPFRFCASAKYKDSCSNKSHPAYKQCVNGPVETVGDWASHGYYFKNQACALCNGKTVSQYRSSFRLCDRIGFPLRFSMVFNEEQQAGQDLIFSPVVKKTCPEGQVYDDILKYCREGVITNVHDTLSDLFFIILSFEPGAIEIPSKVPLQNITKHLKLSLAKKFALKLNQLTGFQFYGQYLNMSFVATFHLTLTPYQEFIFDNQNSISNMSISTESQQFLGLLKFTTNFTMESGGYHFPIIKLISKQLACFEGRTLQSHEYQVDNISGNVIQKNTRKVFSQNEYTILGKTGENITICRRLVFSGCHDNAFVTLNEHEYFVYKNLTIFHYRTNKTFIFGEYQIIEGGGPNRTNFDLFQNASFPRNSKIALCLPLRQTFNTTEKIKVVTKTGTGPLRILTLICFSISILFLSILLVTYWMFNELRTLPGLNLMSLAVSMLLSQLIWLLGTAQFKNTKACKVLGIIEHYLFLVAFMAMSAISYHSCIVFSRPFNTISNNARPVLPKFTKYSSIVWISPAIFIAVCVTLDQTEATFHIYGITCWLSTGKAVVFLFILPAAVIILFNIATFIKTALALCYNKDTEILRKNRKQNLVVCMKLATLVGLPWLFAFLGVIFPDTVAFEYLFVVFACLQGFYMGVAFVCNKKTLQLYKNWWESRNTARNQSDNV